MAKDKILSEIKDAEGNARKIVENGIKSKHDRINNARAEAREIIKQAEADAHRSAQNAIKSSEEAVALEREEIIRAGKNDAEAIAIKSSSKVDKAVDMLLTEFERAVHA
ncbi:H(+)-transporting ATP synthase, subunit H [Methanolobus psychrophilus R15]|nr:H(+)-transporting ATP synthase, subunit H [Methanolobus psychrophilus R15]